VNMRCLDSIPTNIKIIPFDGRHWERHGDQLSQLSSGDSRRDLRRVASKP
jgi:hypothetical protein